MQKTNPSRRPWFILLSAILIQAGSLGVMVNLSGVLFSGIVADMGFRTGDLSVYYTIKALTSAITVGPVAHLFMKKRSRYLIPLLGACLSISFIAMSRFSVLWQWYLSAIFGGIGSCWIFVVVPITLHNWFKSQTGLITGLSLAASGVASAILAPVFSALIAASGWRSAALLMGIIGIASICLPGLFFVPTPEQIGCVPYKKESPKKKKADRSPITTSTLVPNWVFPVSLITMLGASAMCQFNNQAPLFARDAGYTLEFGGTLVSAIMIGNLLGKLLFGFITDRLGVFRAARWLIYCTTASMLIFWCFAQQKTALIIGAALFGGTFALSTLLPSLLYLHLYGVAHYQKPLSRMQTFNWITMSLSGVIFPYLYDWTGSFLPVFIFGLAIFIPSIAIMFSFEHRTKKTA